ncbi:MAG: C40 family peptidase, partial [Amnibacterium sp.]
MSTTATAVVAVSLTAVGVGGATAAPAPQPACSSITPASKSAADIRVAVDRLTSCLSGLQKASDAAGRTAQVADEHYLKAKAAAAKAAAAYRAAEKASSAAPAKALRSRARAAVVAANLARSGSADQAANLLLDGGGATRVLYRVSRMSQLSMQSTQIFNDAKADEHTARVLAAKASNAADSAQRAADSTQAAFAKAKRDANAAEAVVRNQRSRVQALQAELAALAPRPVVQASSGSSSSGGSGSASASVSVSSLPANASVAARVLAFARSQIGDPYVFAAAGPNAWDCSGLTMAAYGAAGIGIGGHSATAQYDTAASEGKLVSYADRQPGDLLFWTDGGGDMYHVAIYSGGGNMVEAPQEGENVREVPVRTYQLVGQV